MSSYWKNIFTQNDVNCADTHWKGPHSLKARKRLRMALAYRHNHKCHWCGREVFLTEVGDVNHEATIDHLIPRVLGGTCGEDLNNLVLACKTCNNNKGEIIYPFNLEYDTLES